MNKSILIAAIIISAGQLHAQRTTKTIRNCTNIPIEVQLTTFLSPTKPIIDEFIKPRRDRRITYNQTNLDKFMIIVPDRTTFILEEEDLSIGKQSNLTHHAIIEVNDSCLAFSNEINDNRCLIFRSYPENLAEIKT